MLFPSSAALTIAAALPPLRSSIIACPPCFACSDVSSRLPFMRFHAGVSARLFLEQTSLGDFRTFSFHSASVKMLNEPIVFFVGVIDNGIFLTADS
ncbi:unnamed protein product [Angiostrongylus costaricensis]|uniref:Secreted protein n=1 Tax=Angiostrongylus costaricensis TaxID=334426 RepID=A0A0R3PNR9_ANGCS|nr:unnamed protein product [Angiostrongylus costaricensis]